ncbi:MAG TPA: SPFH domain-containing protein, partial [Acidimicrobiia bacterium]|nr:SPFH domain-containing protein [Acidimicrobiia bacterium]
IVTALEGDPLPSGDIAGRLGGFRDLTILEEQGATDAELIDEIIGTKNELHNNYQDFQLFLDNGGKIGLQHDPLLYGAYLLNPFLVRVELVPMLVVNQGEVAVIKGYVGLPTLDTSGIEFKHGSIVRPGHRGIWQEPLRTGKFPINPRCYAAEIVPTSILTLNWSVENSQAHDLDAHLTAINGKSREGFVFSLELQVQIHVPDTKAPKVISMVGTMMNLVNEVLQSAVGNHFRNTLQASEAVVFIETRQQVQENALRAVTEHLASYEVETKGVYIQDVEFPPALVEVLTRREIANQEKATFQEQERAQIVRVQMEKAKGTADMQSSLASAQVKVEISQNEAKAQEAQAQGQAAFISTTGRAEGEKITAIGLANASAKEAYVLAVAKGAEALGLARARGYEEQVNAVGVQTTGLVAVANSISEGNIKVMPEILVNGGGGAGEGLAATLMGWLKHMGDDTPLKPLDQKGKPLVGVGSSLEKEQKPPAQKQNPNL